ncbi:hypothetical protein OGM84_11265 [Pediococcus acidilactici]
MLVPVPEDPKQNSAVDFQNMMNMFTQMQQGKTPTDFQPSGQNVPDDIKEKRMDTASKLAKGLLENEMVTIEMDDPKQNNNNNMMERSCWFWYW